MFVLLLLVMGGGNRSNTEIDPVLPRLVDRRNLYALHVESLGSQHISRLVRGEQHGIGRGLHQRLERPGVAVVGVRVSAQDEVHHIEIAGLHYDRHHALQPARWRGLLNVIRQVWVNHYDLISALEEIALLTERPYCQVTMRHVQSAYLPGNIYVGA